MQAFAGREINNLMSGLFIPVHAERRLFIRERSDGLYTVFSYLVCKLIEEVFLALFTSLIFSSWVFYAVKFQGSYGLFWIVYYIVLANGIGEELDCLYIIHQLPRSLKRFFILEPFLLQLWVTS